MHILPSKRAGLIYPYPQDEESVHQEKSYKVQGLGGTVQTFGFPIPQKAQRYKEFTEKMGMVERDLEKIGE